MSPTPEQHLFAAVRAYVRAVYGESHRPALVRITLDDGAKIGLPLPPCPCPVAPALPRDDDDRDCRADILAVLGEAGRRLTTSQILSELERRDWIHGERTVRGRLADMVEDGQLTNDRRAVPPGYAPAH